MRTAKPTRGFHADFAVSLEPTSLRHGTLASIERRFLRQAPRRQVTKLIKRRDLSVDEHDAYAGTTKRQPGQRRTGLRMPAPGPQES